MSAYRGESGFSHDAPPRLGVLLVNLGTPDAPTPSAVRRYLAEFLSDPRVVELPRLLWLPVLHGVVLRLRPRRVAGAYRKIWTEEGSPLLAISRRQQRLLQEELERRLSGPVTVVLAMRYGSPSIADGLRALEEARARRVLVLPLYPQYSATTTASVFDAVTAELGTRRWIPELRFIHHYHDEPGYIRTLADHIRGFWEREGEPERLLLSFHGIPKHYFLAGDPYFCQCQRTARLLAEALNLPEKRWRVAFQSRFGRAEWLTPYTDRTLEAWARTGIKRVDVVCPGFPADCLETLEEIALQNRDRFLAAGGERYRYIPALNDMPDHIRALAELAVRHVQGWPEADPAYDPETACREAAAAQRRARALGAPR